MPFDPTLPLAHAPNSSQVMRDQLNALNDRLTAAEAALGGTARNPNMSTLSISFSNPPTQGELATFLTAFNDLLNQLTRV